MSAIFFFFLFLLTIVSSEVLLEMAFDLSKKEATETGYKAADALNQYLQSTNLKWLRSFHVLVSGQVLKSQRVSLLAFKDAKGWAAFEDEQLAKTHALFDHFWFNGRRILWHEAPETQKYPTNERTVEHSGGFVWQFKYTVIAGKEAEFETIWKNTAQKAIGELSGNKGFVESHKFQAGNMQKTFQNMITWEFLSTSSLVEGVVDSSVMQAFFAVLPKYCSDWNTVLLAPPTDENGKSAGFFFPAAGADKAEEL